MKHQVHTDQIAALSESGKVIKAYQNPNNTTHAATAVELMGKCRLRFHPVHDSSPSKSYRNGPCSS